MAKLEVCIGDLQVTKIITTKESLGDNMSRIQELITELSSLGVDIVDIEEAKMAPNNGFINISQHGKYLVAVDGNGKMIGGQLSLTIKSEMNEPTKATIEFIVGSINKI